MKSLAFAIALMFLTSPVAAFAAAGSAPADEYFGAYRLSVLGIRNALADLGSASDADASAKVRGIEDAVTDWRTQFPADPWIPAAGLRLAKLYTRLAADGVAGAYNLALVTDTWLVADYPESDEGIVAAHLRSRLQAHDPSAPVEAASVEAWPVGSASVVAAPAASAPAVVEVLAPQAAPAPVAAPAPQMHNATVPIVVGTVVAGAAAWLLLRHH